LAVFELADVYSIVLPVKCYILEFEVFLGWSIIVIHKSRPGLRTKNTKLSTGKVQDK